MNQARRCSIGVACVLCCALGFRATELSLARSPNAGYDASSIRDSTKHTQRRLPDFKIVTNTDSLPEGKNISPKVLRFHEITLPEGFANDEALVALFPGDAQHVEIYDTIKRIYWRCTKCHPVRFPMKMCNEWEYFADSSDEDTRFLGRFEYKDTAGKRHIFISTYTSDAQSEGFLTGRTTCGIVTLALFRQDSDGRFTMTSYAPTIGCYGQFCTPSEPEPIEIAPGKYALDFPDYEQAGGGPVFEYSHLVEPEGQGFRHSLELWETGHSNLSVTDYHSTLTSEKPALHNGHYDLLLVTQGTFSLGDFDSTEQLPPLPTKVLHAASLTDSIGFVWKRHYRFGSHNYRLFKEETSIKKLAAIRRRKR